MSEWCQWGGDTHDALVDAMVSTKRENHQAGLLNRAAYHSGIQDAYGTEDIEPESVGEDRVLKVRVPKGLVQLAGLGQVKLRPRRRRTHRVRVPRLHGLADARACATNRCVEHTLDWVVFDRIVPQSVLVNHVSILVDGERIIVIRYFLQMSPSVVSTVVKKGVGNEFSVQQRLCHGLRTVDGAHDDYDRAEYRQRGRVEAASP